ncbi:hypothetical protein NM688_g3739 [Phlebia brevispora]|uniref:Uncharacterized protein n=1 Tax=Phlebia brevispora TaxID=194682 RepID=A0ACC1T4U2_9APHY|nr:hypothetical protein NM688_g3739 [Phlebia brevispora]
MESTPTDPTLLFSPDVKAKTANTAQQPTSGIKGAVVTPQRSSVTPAPTRWPTQTKKDEEVARKLQSQKLAVGRKMLSPSTRPTGKLRSQPLDSARKASAKGTGTSVTVVTRTVRVPIPRSSLPGLKSRDSTTPDAEDAVSKSPTGKAKTGSKNRRVLKKTADSLEKGTFETVGAQRKARGSQLPTKAAETRAVQETATPVRYPKGRTTGDAASTKPVSRHPKRKTLVAKE